jgi:hypothetical protein
MIDRQHRPVPARRLLGAALGALTILALAVVPALAHGSARTASVLGRSVEAAGAAHGVTESPDYAHPRHATVTVAKAKVVHTKVTKVTKATTVETDAPEANDTDQGDQNNVDEGDQGDTDNVEDGDQNNVDQGDQGEQDQPDATDNQSGDSGQSGDTSGD